MRDTQLSQNLSSTLGLMKMKGQIIAQHEERLRQAQLKSDVAALSELIADEIQFVFLDGSVTTKEMDLEAHRTGNIRVQSIDFSEGDIRYLSDSVVTATVKAAMVVVFQGEEVRGNYRYCRTWLERNGRWQIVAGCVSRCL